MTTNSPNRPRASGRLEGRHVLWTLLGFFGVIFTVNGYFMYAALSTYSGVVASEPYRKGLAYNDRIAASERQTSRGWHDTLDVTRDGRISLIVRDQSGVAVSGLKVTATLARPSTAGHDHTAILNEQYDGRYAADIAQREAGNWIATIEARESSSTEPVFRSRRRLWLKP